MSLLQQLRVLWGREWCDWDPLVPQFPRLYTAGVILVPVLGLLRVHWGSGRFAEQRPWGTCHALCAVVIILATASGSFLPVLSSFVHHPAARSSPWLTLEGHALPRSLPTAKREDGGLSFRRASDPFPRVPAQSDWWSPILPSIPGQAPASSRHAPPRPGPRGPLMVCRQQPCGASSQCPPRQLAGSRASWAGGDWLATPPLL